MPGKGRSKYRSYSQTHPRVGRVSELKANDGGVQEGDVQ